MKKRIYDKYKKHNFWAAIDGAIDTLCINGDLEEKTARYYIVGYLTKCLCEQKRKPKTVKKMVGAANVKIGEVVKSRPGKK